MSIFQRVIRSAVPTLLCSLCACSSNSSTESIVDVPSFPESYYLETAMDTYQRGLFTRSREYWLQLINGYPGSPYVPLAELKIADSFYFAEKYSEAVEAYKTFLASNPAGDARDYAQLQIANAHYYSYQGPGLDITPLKTARSLFEQFLREFPGSPLLETAQLRLDRCQFHLAQDEKRIAAFYAKQGMKTGRKS